MKSRPQSGAFENEDLILKTVQTKGEQMDFIEFIAMVKNEIKEYLPKEYADKTVDVKKIAKVGGGYVGLSVIDEGQPIVPTVDMETFFEVYQDGATKEEIMERIAELLMVKPPALFDGADASKYELIKSKLFVRLCNVSQNQGILKDVPHRIFGDIAAVCYIVFSSAGNDYFSTPITNELFRRYGITEEQLFEDAYANADRMFPKIIDKVPGPADKDGGYVYYITNSRKYYGSSAMFYPGALEAIAEFMGDDYYLIPSSVHEMALLPKSKNKDIPMLRQILGELNEENLQKKDYLSDNLFVYSRENKELSVVKD